MDLQQYLNNAVSANRKESLSKSDQLTLGEMILKLEPIIKNQSYVIGKYELEAKVVYDFAYIFPTKIDSWRGAYDELALNYTQNGEQMGVIDFHKMLTESVGKEFTGYKGGEYTMSKHTPVWVANYGEGCHTAVIDIVDNEYEVIIITGYREY